METASWQVRRTHAAASWFPLLAALKPKGHSQTALPFVFTRTQPRKTTFANPNPTHVFGMKLPSDAEGAKQGE